MEFSEDSGNATYRIQAYRQGCIKVSGHEYHHPLLIMPEKLISPWEVGSVDELTVQHFEILLSYRPQVVLIGTGPEVHFLKAEVTSPLIRKGIGVETMTSSAACKTYTLLMSEGRNVAALIFV